MAKNTNTHANENASDKEVSANPATTNSDFSSSQLNQNEFKSVRSLVAYVAYTHHVSEETVAAVLTTKFKVEEVKALPSTQYDDAVRFLVDLRLDEVMN